MDDVESSLLSATKLEEEGQVKDAYMAYLSTAQWSLEALKDIKFVRLAIVSQPKQYSALISAMRTCLTHIEHIIETHSPSAKTQIPIDHTVAATSTSAHPFTKAPPPPLPPKPSRIHKPSIPPKPTLSRPPSPTLGQEPPPKPRIVAHNNNEVSRPSSVPQPANPLLDRFRRPHSEYQSDEVEPSQDRAIAFSKIDPTHLVPAQTNAGDSLSPPTGTSLNTEHVPLVPAPPLLTTHRILQARLDELEVSIKEHRKYMGSDASQTTILQETRHAADIKLVLNRVRTLYMSAATVPTILQFPTHLVAYQVTLIESAIFCAIPPKALLEHSAKHPHPRIVASTDFFNYLTRVIENSILLPQEASSRAQHVNHWIKVANKCLDLNNYQTLKAIVSALGTPPVQRLRRTWAYIPKKSMTKLDTLNELMSEADNYGKYREHMGMTNGKYVRLEHLQRPTVPFLGTFIHDMTYLLAASATAEDARVAAILKTIENFQKQAPQYTASPPTWFIKAAQKHHHHLRPAALSSAIHRSATGIGRLSGSMFGSSSSYSSSQQQQQQIDSDDGPAILEEGSLEEQQQTVTQYILMRSWVSQNTVDELSVLREPPRQQTSNNRPSTNSHRSTTGSSSVMSSTSSLMRFSTGSISLSRGTSMEDEELDPQAPRIPPRPPPRKDTLS